MGKAKALKASSNLLPLLPRYSPIAYRLRSSRFPRPKAALSHRFPIVSPPRKENTMKKRLPVILACFILLSAAALAAGVSVTLHASDSVEIQAAAFTAYLDSLNEADQREWQQALQQMLSPDQADAGAADSERLVYITPKGEVYHSTEQCASLSRSKTINSLTLGEAVTNGRRPCKICAGK